MDTIKYKELLLQTALVTMASDGNIAESEIVKLKEIFGQIENFKYVNLDTEISKFITTLNERGNDCFQNFYKQLETLELSETEQLEIIDVAIQMIKADNVIEYAEVKFFKALRYHLKIKDEKVIEKLKDVHDDISLFLGQDIESSIPEYQYSNDIILSVERIM
jgi:uncharacterized tellurite resistance protein B-like protein